MTPKQLMDIDLAAKQIVRLVDSEGIRTYKRQAIADAAFNIQQIVKKEIEELDKKNGNSNF